MAGLTEVSAPDWQSWGEHGWSLIKLQDTAKSFVIDQAAILQLQQWRIINSPKSVTESSCTALSAALLDLCKDGLPPTDVSFKALIPWVDPKSSAPLRKVALQQMVCALQGADADVRNKMAPNSPSAARLDDIAKAITALAAVVSDLQKKIDSPSMAPAARGSSLSAGSLEACDDQPETNQAKRARLMSLAMSNVVSATVAKETLSSAGNIRAKSGRFLCFKAVVTDAYMLDGAIADPNQKLSNEKSDGIVER
jgi:hypothetical protein